jgi:hypothetical protein
VHEELPLTVFVFVFASQAVSASKGKDAKMDWEAIHGLMEDAIYGGRIDNAFDLRVLRAYLRYGVM